MPALHDIGCSVCDHTETNHFFSDSARIDQTMPEHCGKPMEILWTETGSVHLPCHPKETIVYWRNPQTGEIRYPARNDVPIPPKYKAMGYERHEIRNLAEVHKFEKANKVTSEIANFDRGTGRGMEDTPRSKMRK